MGSKITPGRFVASVGVVLLVCYLNTLIVWLWPESSLWALGGVIVLAAIFVTFVYRSTRKSTRPEVSEQDDQSRR